MRPKFILALLFVAVLVLGAALLLKQHLGGGSSAPASSASVAAVPQVSTSVVATVAPLPEPAPAPLPTTPAITNTLTPEAIDAEVDRLFELSTKDDPASLSNILAQLTNPNEDIREAAIEAAKQFGSTNAIPALKAAAEATDDLQQKIAYLEAADFLSLPPAEFDRRAGTTPKTPEQIQRDQQKQAAREARRRQSHGPVPDPNSQSSPANSQNTAQPSGPNQ